MASGVRFGRLIRLFGTAVLAAALSGCVSTLPLKETFDEPPLFPQIAARVGTACRVPIHTADYVQGIYRVDFDRISLTRFEQVYRALFSEVVPLPVWPPWRSQPPALDGVIELEEAQLSTFLGDERGNPDKVAVFYRACLYRPDGALVSCVDGRAEQVYQRVPFEVYRISAHLAALVETASREALARFVLAFEKDAAVWNWARQVVAKGGPR